jgi:hypothetical protein
MGMPLADERLYLRAIAPVLQRVFLVTGIAAIKERASDAFVVPDHYSVGTPFFGTRMRVHVAYSSRGLMRQRDFSRRLLSLHINAQVHDDGCAKHSAPGQQEQPRRKVAS